MPTPIERVVAYTNALLGYEASETQIRVIADAYAFKASSIEIEEYFGTTYENLNDEQKCIVLLEMLKREAKTHIRYAAEQKTMAQVAITVSQAGNVAEALL